MNRKRPASKDRFRAGRRAAARAVRKFHPDQLVFPWMSDPGLATSADDAAWARPAAAAAIAQTRRRANG